MAEKSSEHLEPRIYTREFKLEAVRLSESSEKTVAQIARDLGMPERVLYRWRRDLRERPEQAFPGKGHQSELEDENRRLTRELELLRQEREILKKRWPSSRAASHEVRIRRRPDPGLRRVRHVPGAGSLRQWLLRLAPPHTQCSPARRHRLERPDPQRLCRRTRGVGQSTGARSAAPPGDPRWAQTGCAPHAGAGPVCHASAAPQAADD
jgi:transposase